MQRSRVYWDQVLAPALREGKTLLVVGHENNLRSLLMRLEGIPADDIIHLSLPRAVPLAYTLDPQTLEPINRRPDGVLDEATGFLRGEWLGGDQAVTKILQRDEKQVYDTSVQENLEVNASDSKWLDVSVPPPTPEAKAKGDETAGSFVGRVAVPSSMMEPSGPHVMNAA